MKKLSYYTAIEELTNEEGKVFSMRVSDDRLHDFTFKFKTIEDCKRAIDNIYRARQRKDITRHYPDGTTKRISQTDTNDIKYTIRKHYEEIEELEVIEHPRAIDKGNQEYQEELDVYI